MSEERFHLDDGFVECVMSGEHLWTEMGYHGNFFMDRLPEELRVCRRCFATNLPNIVFRSGRYGGEDWGKYYLVRLHAEAETP